jgi:lysophospholipase L1-like esterase
LVVYGDSLSAGSGSDLNDPALWPSKAERLLDSAGRDWTVSNRSINGNGLVWKTRCFGVPAADRLKAELDAIPAGSTIVLMAGVNDTIQPNLPAGFSPCFEPSNWSAEPIVAALRDLAQRAGGRRILLATIPPFAASEYHSAKAEATRVETNRWIRANWATGDVIDLDSVLGDPSDRSRLRADFDSGDGLHPNEAGAAAIAAAVAGMLRAG